MIRCMRSAVMALLVLAFAAFAQEGDANDSESETGVRIALTKLEVNNVTLKLQYRIENGSDHNIWVLRSIDLFFESLHSEVIMSKDGQTLLVRRRLDVPRGSTFGRGDWPWGTYVLLQPSKSLSETVSLKLPVETKPVFITTGARFVEQATRLRLEIGYYDEDLPKLVRGILRGAAGFGDSPFTEEQEILREYFRGLRVRDMLGELSSFDGRNPAPYDDGLVNLRYSLQALTGEKILAFDANGLSIPYDGFIEYSPP